MLAPPLGRVVLRTRFWIEAHYGLTGSLLWLLEGSVGTAYLEEEGNPLRSSILNVA